MCGDTDAFPRRVDPDDVSAQARRQPADLPVSAADVEHPTCTAQLGGRKRQDLLLVLGVRTVGEPLDPPVRMGFPQARVAHVFSATRERTVTFSACEV